MPEEPARKSKRERGPEKESKVKEEMAENEDDNDSEFLGANDVPSPPSCVDSQASGDEASQAEPEPEADGVVKEEDEEDDKDVFGGDFSQEAKPRENTMDRVSTGAKTLLDDKFESSLVATFPKDLGEPSGSTFVCSPAPPAFVLLLR